MLKRVFLIFAIVGFILAAIIHNQPNEFRVSRSMMMKAPASAVFKQVNNVRAFNKWSPWAKMEPTATMTYEGPSAGVGAVSRWDGKKIGAGQSTIVESKANKSVRMKLEFLKPFKSTSETQWTFKSKGNQTVVTWSMYGKNNFPSKAMSLVMNCEKIVGEQFDQGLTNLKATVEKK